VTTLQAVTWAGTARRIPRRLSSAGKQYTRYCALGQGCKDPKPLRPIRRCSVALFALSPRQGADRARYGGTSQLASIDSHHRNHDGREGLLVPHASILFNCSFVSYCPDSPLCIIVTTTYSDIEPPSRSASSTSRLRNAPQLLASCHTFCLNPRQSSRGLCLVQVVLNTFHSLWKG